MIGGITFPKIGTSQTPVNNRRYNNGTATINFTYDNSGNLTAAGATTYQWDGANRGQVSGVWCRVLGVMI